MLLWHALILFIYTKVGTVSFVILTIRLDEFSIFTGKSPEAWKN